MVRMGQDNDASYKLLADNPELMRIFAIQIRVVLLRQSQHHLALPKVQDLKELRMTLAARFGPLSSATLSQLEQASLEQIEAWFDRAITARSLSDVLDGGD